MEKPSLAATIPECSVRSPFAFGVLLLSALLLAGCENGPNDRYQPAPASAGAVWNNGNTPAVVDDAGTSFGAVYGGTSKTEICSGAELQDQWQRMVQQPIAPPYHMAGVDISGVNYQVLTVEQAENGIDGQLMPVPGAANPPTRLCQGANLGSGSNGGDIGGSLVTTWGNNGEFYMEWAIHTHKDYFNYINPGYTGGMDWTFAMDPAGCPQDKTYAIDGASHKYHWQIGSPLQKDGQDFHLDWSGYNTPPSSSVFYCEADELYRGLTSYFVPDLYDNLPPGVQCNSTGRCPVFPNGNDGVHPILGFRTISAYWDMGPPSQPQPSGSTPHDMYFFNIKYAPYSPAVSWLKMDGLGPTGTLNPIGNQNPPATCQLALGGTFGDLANGCINVFADTAVNTSAMAKVLGNLTHDDQNFSFSIVGINQNYRPPQLDIGGSRQFDIIHDNETPQADAIATDFQLDVRANGPILNDRFPTSIPGVYRRDNHGAGAMWREWGRLVQTDLAAKYAAQYGGTPKTLHDPSCLFPMSCQGTDPACAAAVKSYGQCTAAVDANKQPLCAWTYNWAPGQSPSTWRAAPGCTGFEGLIDEAYPNTRALDGLPFNAADATATDPDNVFDVGYALGNLSDNGLRPGTPFSNFCMDPGIYNFCGSPSLYGASNDLLAAATQMVLQILGNGDPNNLPTGVGDRRYFFAKWTEAYAKYMQSGASMHLGQNATPADPVPYFGDYNLNTDDFFFDSYGGNANRSEFIQWDFADNTHDPTDLNISMLLIGSNLQEVHFYRRLDREERALFMALGQADAKAIGQAPWALLRDGNGNIVKDEWNQPRKNAGIFLTNFAGSPAIAAGPWTQATYGANDPRGKKGDPVLVGTPTAYDPCLPLTPPAQVTKTAWYCATHVDADCAASGAQAPTDDAGNLLTRPSGEPILSGYCGVWNPTVLSLGSTSIKVINDDITPQQQQLEQEAEVEIPNYANPYDPTTAATPIRVLVPWLPSQNGVGFPVATTGQQDVFVQTAELDFAGQVIVPVMDYQPVTLMSGGQPHTAAKVLAYESQDFLGDVFLCYDPVTASNRAGTGRPGDILLARMYTPVDEILSWLQAHPTAQDACSIIIRYSPFNNFPDYISSLTNGVRLGIDLGAGRGRVTDVTVFTPGVGAPAPP